MRRLVDLRGHVRGRPAVEVRRPRPPEPRLQPFELRPRPSASCFSAPSTQTRWRCGGGRRSPALVLALVLIVAGGFLILRRLHLVGVALGFWLSFAAGIGVLAASGHTMNAAWHVGPIEGLEFWWLLVSSPEILVFLFMITDPKTIPAEPRRTASRGRRRAVGDAAHRAADDRVRDEGGDPRGALRRLRGARRDRARRLGTARGHHTSAASAADGRSGCLRERRGRMPVPGRGCGHPGPPGSRSSGCAGSPAALPEVTVVDSQGVAGIDEATAPADSPRRRDRPAHRVRRPSDGRPRPRGRCRGRLVARPRSGRQIDAAAMTVANSDVDRIELTLLPGATRALRAS